MEETFVLLNQFHFLRPLWLFLLLLLPVLVFLANRSTKTNSSWSQAINPKLLKHLLSKQEQNHNKWPLYLFLVGFSFCLLALAGPVWKKIPQQAHQVDDGLVIVLDLSLSMEATDLKPSRIVAARHKLSDLLKERQQGQTALIVYAGDAHTVSPLTDDTETIIAMVPALSPLIMPVLGSRVAEGIQKAIKVFKNSNISKGRILLLTDGIEEKDIQHIHFQLDNTDYKLSILVVGTPDGSPIPTPNQSFLRDKNKIVIAKTNIPRLQRLAQKTGALIANLSLDSTDIKALLPNDLLGFNKTTHEVERVIDKWSEEGPWLILLLLPLAALSFRRGWLLSLFILVLAQPQPVEASDWLDQLWQTADQKAASAFADENYDEASKLFTSIEWQGANAYKNKDFSTAIKYFSKSDSAQGHYNRGNALAKLEQFEEAIKAYDEALKSAPHLTDAKTNKQIIEGIIRQQQSEQQQSEQQQSEQQQSEQQQSEQQQSEQQQSEQQQSKQQQSEQQQSEQQQSEQQQSEQQQSKQQQSKQQQSKQQQSKQQQSKQQQSKQQQSKQQQSKQQQSEQQQSQDVNGSKSEEQNAEKEQFQLKPESEPPSDNDDVEKSKQKNTIEERKKQNMSEAKPLTTEQQQAMEQWLRRIPDDASILLRRKFNYQYQQNKRNNQFVPQQENAPIW